MNRLRSPAAVTSLISLDRNGVISAWDAAARRLLAYAPSEVVGRRLATLAPGGSSDRLDRAIERAAAGEPTDGTGRLVAKHGRHVEVAVLLRPVPGAAGVAGVAVGIVDVWAARERDAATARRAAELEARRWARDLHSEALSELEAVEARLATTLTASDYDELRTGSRSAHDQLAAALGGLRRLIRDSDPVQTAGAYPADPDDPWALLTPRQREVGELAARGHSNLEIAQMLALSSGTVKTRLSQVYRKLGVSGRTAAAARLNRRPTSGTFATLPIDEAGDRVG